MPKDNFLSDNMTLMWRLIPKKDSFVVVPLVSMMINVALACLLSLVTRTPDPILLDRGFQLISRVTGTSISIVTLTFSLTVLSVQIASQTYSPRLLDDFLKDPVSKMVISVNLGAFVYCYTLLYFLDGHDPEVASVPYVAIQFVSVHCGVVLISFINFIHVFINGFRIETILKRAADSSYNAANTLSAFNTDLTREELPDIPGHAIKVRADLSGYIINFCFPQILNTVEELDICIRYTNQIGDYVNRGTVLAYAWDTKYNEKDNDVKALGKRVIETIDLPTDESKEEDEERPFDNKVENRLGRLVNKGVQFAKKRSSDLDVTLGIQQLADIAVRALSPGINDPQTAIQCMDVLSSLLASLAYMDLGLPNARDEKGDVRVCAPRRSYPYLLSMIDSIRRYGGSDLSVCRRGLRLFGDLAVIATQMDRLDHIPTLLAQLDQWMSVAKENHHEGSLELKSLEDLHAHIQRSIAESENFVLKDEDGVKDLQDFETTYNASEREGMDPSERNRNMVSDFLHKMSNPSSNGR